MKLVNNVFWKLNSIYFISYYRKTQSNKFLLHVIGPNSHIDRPLIMPRAEAVKLIVTEFWTCFFFWYPSLEVILFELRTIIMTIKLFLQLFNLCWAGTIPLQLIPMLDNNFERIWDMLSTVITDVVYQITYIQTQDFSNNPVYVVLNSNTRFFFKT